MKIKIFQMGQNATNCYIVFNENSGAAFCVDVSDKITEDYFDFIDSNKLAVKYLLLTHGHFDHTQDILHFHQHFPDAKIVISQTDYDSILQNRYIFCPPECFCTPDIPVNDNDVLDFDGQSIRVIATPGHSSGSVCYLFENHLFCGDTVFAGSVGRSDLPTGSFMVLIQSIQKIKALGNCKLYPGHMEVTDLSKEKESNPFFKI